MPAESVLLVEDDRAIVEFVNLGLGYEGFEVTHADSVRTALRCLRQSLPRLVVLDLLLPDDSGLAVLRDLRSRGLSVPVLILSAQGDVDDRVAGLRAGADDYLTKPFRFDELLARMRAILRRTETHPSSELIVGDITMDLHGHRVWVSGQRVDVVGLEYQLLELLLHNAGRVLTREVLLSRVWGLDSWSASNVLESRISRLRRALGPAAAQIQTVRGVGYIARPSD